MTKIALDEELVAAVRRGTESFRVAMADLAHAMRAVGYSFEGKHVLAEVVRTQEGRQIVRDRMRDVRIWTGEIEDHPCGHERRTTGCGGCDPAAIEFIYEDGRWRAYVPGVDGP